MSKKKIGKDIYATPEAELAQISKDEDVLTTLKRQQSITIAVIIAMVTTVAVLEGLARWIGQMPMYTFLIPGFVAGGLVKILARPFSLVARVIPGLIVAVLVFGYFSLRGFTVFSFFLPFLNFLVFLALSRRFMSYEQEAALYRKRLGR